MFSPSPETKKKPLTFPCQIELTFFFPWTKPFANTRPAQQEKTQLATWTSRHIVKKKTPWEIRTADVNGSRGSIPSNGKTTFSRRGGHSFFLARLSVSLYLTVLFEGSEWPASWHRNPCLVIHPNQVCSWTGKRMGRFEWTAGTREPHFATSQDHSTRNPASLHRSQKKEWSFFFFKRASSNKRGCPLSMTSLPWRQTTSHSESGQRAFFFLLSSCLKKKNFFSIQSASPF